MRLRRHLGAGCGALVEGYAEGGQGSHCRGAHLRSPVEVRRDPCHWEVESSVLAFLASLEAGQRGGSAAGWALLTLCSRVAGQGQERTRTNFKL